VRYIRICSVWVRVILLGLVYGQSEVRPGHMFGGGGGGGKLSYVWFSGWTDVCSLALIPRNVKTGCKTDLVVIASVSRGCLRELPPRTAVFSSPPTHQYSLHAGGLSFDCSQPRCPWSASWTLPVLLWHVREWV